MRQFFAILKDSFREAVDGFVIYAMLGLSALAILIVGSMSFTPAPPQEAFEHMTSQFNAIFAEKGRSRHLSVGTNSAYAVSDVAPEGSGYKLRLTVTAIPSSRILRGSEMVPDTTKGDSFRSTVAQWAGRTGKTMSITVPNKDGATKKEQGKKIEFAQSVQYADEEQRAVTTELMEEFLKSQFDMHAGMTVTVKRVTEGVAEPTYAFNVTTVGGTGVRGWPHTTKIFFGTVTVSKQASLGQALWVLEDRIINGVGAAVALLIAVIITAFYIPNMLRKGSLDLLISKPMGRIPLLLYKYIGGLTFIFLLSAFTVGGVWLVLALRSGYWDPTFLILIPVLTFSFAILYAVSVLFAVLTRSPIVAMLATIGFMFIVWLAGFGKNLVELTSKEGEDEALPGWLVTIINAVNTVLPRYKDLDTITSKLIVDGTLTPVESRMLAPLIGLLDYPAWGTTIGVSLAFIAIMLALACWRFKKRDS